MNDLKNLITGSQRADLKSFVHKYIGNNDYAQSVNLDEFFEQNYDDFCKTVSEPYDFRSQFFLAKTRYLRAYRVRGHHEVLPPLPMACDLHVQVC